MLRDAAVTSYLSSKCIRIPFDRETIMGAVDAGIRVKICPAYVSFFFGWKSMRVQSCFRD